MSLSLRKLWKNRTSGKAAQRPKIPVDFPDTLRRLNHLVERLRIKNYLEIGLGNGGTFDGVAAPLKVGVDPHPWNPGLRDLDGVLISTSDRYFSEHWNRPIKFDLILLDGLHTAEQTYRDFVNSLHFAHARTVWLIDDVMPNDAFSAIPDPVEAIKQRTAQTGSNDASWHGDVYKVVWMIKTFHNNMRLRTFGPQQPQALVYFSPSAGTLVSGATLGEVASLTYQDTVSRRNEYDIGDEGEILEECVAAVSSKSRALQ
jgi:hypothetical protein